VEEWRHGRRDSCVAGGGLCIGLCASSRGVDGRSRERGSVLVNGCGFGGASASERGARQDRLLYAHESAWRSLRLEAPLPLDASSAPRRLGVGCEQRVG